MPINGCFHKYTTHIITITVGLSSLNAQEDNIPPQTNLVHKHDTITVLVLVIGLNCKTT